MIVLTEFADEEGAITAQCVFTDEDGASLVPNTVSWDLYDRNGDVVNSKTAQSETPAATVNINCQGDDLQVTQPGKEPRYIRVYGTYNSTYGTNRPYNKMIRFRVRNLKGVT